MFSDGLTSTYVGHRVPKYTISQMGTNMLLNPRIIIVTELHEYWNLDTIDSITVMVDTIVKGTGALLEAIVV